MLTESHASRFFSAAILSLLLVVGCSQKSGSRSTKIPEGLALGSVAGTLGATGELPLTLKTSHKVLGLQFELVWDTSMVTLGEPKMSAANEHMSVRANNTGGGREKVLVFNMQGKSMDLTDSEVLTIPVTFKSALVGETPIRMTEVVVAGPKAAQLRVPIQNGAVVLNGGGGS